MSNAHYDSSNRNNPPVWLKTAKAVPISGQAYVAPRAVGRLMLDPATDLAALTVKFPLSPYHDQPFSIATTRRIAALTLQPNTSQSIIGGQLVLPLNIGGSIAYRYDIQSSAWYPDDAHITSTAAPSVLTVGASPYTYQNTSGGRQQVLIDAGTLGAVAVSRDGTTFYGAGVMAGAFILNPNDYLRVTYTVAPTMVAMNL